MTDALLADLAAAGWLVNNCYQVDATLWRVSLRRPTPTGDWFSDWAEGPTLADALDECIAKLNDAEFEEDQPISFAQAPTKLDLRALVRKHEPIQRRI